jgi:uncharacterized repeat protein (TIGR01451 family)
MISIRRSTHHTSARGPDPSARRPRRNRGFLLGLVAALFVLALPTAPAFGEGSANLLTGADDDDRQGLNMNGNAGQPIGNGFTVLYVYAQAGEMVQLGSSAMGVDQGNILVYPPGTELDVPAEDFPEDPVFSTDIFDCNSAPPAGDGVIATGTAGRAQELAGPEASPDGDPNTWVPCEFTPTASGIYPVIMMPPDPEGTAGSLGTVGEPVQVPGAWNVAIWDITVRDAGAVQSGRVFSYNYFLGVGGQVADELAASVRVFPYTKTGYEYQMDLADPRGANWSLFSDDMGVVDATTGERRFHSFACGTDAPGDNDCSFFDAGFGPAERRYPLFVNELDLVAISGPGGLGDTRGFSDAPIHPSTNPLSNAAFTGAGGEQGGTDQGSGGTLSFNSATQLEGQDYTVLIDTDRDGVFGNGDDFVDASGDLSIDGTNSFAWDGLDGAGNMPACGDYQYQIRSSVAQVHFPLFDMENSGGTTIERLTLPNDPVLGDEFAANYDDIDTYKTPPYDTTNNPDNVVVDGDSSQPGFHSWSDSTGNTDYIDTWARLPEVQTSGTLQIQCADLGVSKSGPASVEPGGQVTWTLTVTNHGPGNSPGSTVEDQVPAEVTNVSSSTPGCSVAGNTVSCAVGVLASGASTQITVSGTAPAAPSTCFTNTATVAGTTPPDDLNAANNTGTWTTCTNPPPPERADVTLSKRASDSRVLVGKAVTYTMVARNNGPGVATGAAVNDTVPSRLDVRSASSTQGTCQVSGNRVSCAIGTLDVGQEVTVTIRARAIRAGGATNRATVTSERCTATPCGTTPPVEVTIVKPRLRITKSSSARSVRAGQTFGYTIRVSNPSDVGMDRVRTCDRLPAGLVYVSSRPRARLSGGQHCWIVRRLGAGQSRTYRVTVRALPGAIGRKVNTATATSPDARAAARARRTVGVLANQVPGGGVTG